jgi:hypothetical protein
MNFDLFGQYPDRAIPYPKKHMQQSSPWLLRSRVRHGRQATFIDVPFFYFSKKISEKSLLILLNRVKHPYEPIRKSKVCPPHPLLDGIHFSKNRPISDQACNPQSGHALGM